MLEENRKQWRISVLTELCKIQQSCSPINLTIGTVDPETRTVDSNAIVITKAPPTVLSSMLARKDTLASIDERGLILTYLAGNEVGK